MLHFRARHSVVFLFIASLFALFSIRWYRDRQDIQALLPTPSPSPTEAPLNTTCKTTEDCGQGFFCRDGECSEYLYDTSCTDNSDCQLVNNEHGYGCCGMGMCDQKDVSQDEWIAVNIKSFNNSQSEFCPSKEECGPTPLCPEQAINGAWVAECQEAECVKTQPAASAE